MQQQEQLVQEQLEANKPDPAWWIYTGRVKSKQHTLPDKPVPVIPDPPPWRRFNKPTDLSGGPFMLPVPPANLLMDARSETYCPESATIDMVNAALYLGRPLLITGKPGTGKSSLAYSVARELGLGPVLRWNITSRSTLREGLYEYDALRRLADYNMGQPRQIGEYLTLGPLGTALLPWERPRVLLIDEVDKSDIDLPNDLLNVFEEGEFMIREIVGGEVAATSGQNQAADALRVRTYDPGQPLIELSGATVHCARFPVIILTSNGERDFPPPFLRRCLRLYLPPPGETQLMRILQAHFKEIAPKFVDENAPACLALVRDFLTRSVSGDVATDQLLNAIYLTVGPSAPVGESVTAKGESNKAAQERLRSVLLQRLQSGAEVTSTSNPMGK